MIDDLPAQGVVLSGPNGFSMTGSALKARLQELGDMMSTLPQGTRVATLLPDAPATAISLLALVHHVQLMPINPSLSDREIEKILTDGHAAILLSAAQDARAARLAHACSLPLATLNDESILQVPALRGDEKEPGLILLTSGSTGAPKRVPLRPAQLHQSSRRIAQSLKLGADDCAVHALPMFHIGAVVDMLLAPLLQGGSTVICPDRTPTAL